MPLDLNSEDLVPFKTIGVTRSGHKALFQIRVGRDTFRFVVMESTPTRYPEDGYYAVKENGYQVSPRSEGESHNDIVRILKKWKPRVGDIVKAYGYCCENGQSRVAKGTFDWKIDRDLGEGFWRCTNPEEVHIDVHERNMKFIRREGAST